MANQKISDLPYRDGNALNNLDLIEVSAWDENSQSYTSTKMSGLDFRTYLQPLSLNSFTFTPPDTMTAGGSYSLTNWFGNPSDIYKAFDGDLDTSTTHNNDGFGGHAAHGIIQSGQTASLDINLGLVKYGKIFIAADVRNDGAISDTDRTLVQLESEYLIGGTQSEYGNGFNIGTLVNVNGFNYTRIILSCGFWGQYVTLAFVNEGSTAIARIREIQIYV